jgi:stage V sporulation protein D (sporulation-specific penicillin-binding protein)
MDMALAMGVQTFYNYLYAFGFGSATGIKIYGESSGILTPIKYVRNVDLARIGFGQAIAVTPLQLISAVATVVNGGVKMQPYIISQILDSDGGVVASYKPEALAQVISPETSARMREILQAVVEGGSGRNAQIEGYTVGGKTGTAQKYDENGNIMHDVHVSSFVGFAPADDPEVVVLLVVDEPDVPVDYGSIVAAPYVKKILEETLVYMNVPRQNATGSSGDMASVPDVRQMEASQAIAKLKSEGFGYLLEGYSGLVAAQMPPAGEEARKGSTVMIYLADEDPDSGDEYYATVPGVLGMTAVEARDALEEAGLRVEFSGPGGVVIGQSPAAGEIVARGDTVCVVIAYPEADDTG